MTSAAAETAYAFPVYKPSLRWLHWSIAALIFAAIALGVTAIYLPRTPLREDVLLVHKSIGVTVLALVALRVIARVALGAPRYLPPLDLFSRYASTVGHLALYALMFALPISGYVHSAAAGKAFDWFGLFAFPMWIAPDPALGKLAGEVHYIFAWGIGALLAVHVGAALWHALIRKDNVLARMWPRSAGA